ncbi:type III PLP-dependent enzyme [Alphaproteobacteria bacterium]|nr:type III PLP-dependent enzyme [Alphaproteobacteria bacterium]
MTDKCFKWLEKNKPDSPALVFDLSLVKRNFNHLKSLYKNIDIFYAVKANPNKKIIKLLNSLGSFFDCASIWEIEACISSRVSAEKISYGSTLKKAQDIEKAFKLGVKLFAFDSIEELVKISEKAPGSDIFCRIMVPNGGSDWPLSNKFGCSSKTAESLILKSKTLGLNPIGLSFHVGSQQLSLDTWKKAVSQASNVYKSLSKKNIILSFLNMGGGFPASYKNKINNSKIYSTNILKSVEKSFGNLKPVRIIIEPGRFLVAEAGVIETEIILVSSRDKHNKKRWIYIDVGRYNGLAETEGEAIHYEIRSKSSMKVKKENFILAGPSCDSHDIIYKNKECILPKNLKCGDKLRILATGAYTTVYSSNFNGIKNVTEYFIE